MSRLELVVAHERNRTLLADWLAELYAVDAVAAPALDADVDCRVVDEAAFARHEDVLRAWKTDEKPAFAPVLLVNEDPVGERFGPSEWAALDGLYVVDDVVTPPLDRAVFHRRLENLLERRDLSLELHDRYRRSEERFGALFAALPDPALVVGDDDAVRYANDAFRGLCDLGDEAVVGTSLDALAGGPADASPAADGPRDAGSHAALCADAATAIADCAGAARAGSFDEPTETTVRTADGRTRTLELNAAVATIDAEQSVAVVMRDVTGRVERERAVAERGRQFRAVFDGTSDALLLADDDGYYVDANPAACELFGVDREAVLGRRISEFAVEDYDFEATWERFLADEEMRGEFEVARPDGERRTVEFTATADVTPGRHLSALRDVTDRQAIEADLRESEARFRQIVSQVEETIWMVDADASALLYVSPGVEQLTGRTREYFAEDPIWRFVADAHPDDRAEIEAAVEAWLADVEAGDPDDDYHFAFRYVRADDAVVWLHVDAGVVTDGDGAVERIVGIIDDVTELKERERELERQNERLEEFAGMVSHDLRNPLQVILGRIALLRDEVDDPTPVDETERAAERMVQLIDDLLALARDGDDPDEFEPLSLAAVASRAWGSVDGPVASLSVVDDGMVEADPGRLGQLFENLFRNAVEHAGPTVAVEVGLVRDGGEPVGFYVADDGPGIPPDEREAVFDQGYTTSADGTGIGLDIVADVASAHGWSVAATESAAAGTVSDERTAGEARQGGTAGGARFEFTGVTLG